MLEPVAAGRSGRAFVVPGLTQDARGIVIGHEAAIVLHSLDQLLSLLRIASGETALGELFPSLRAEELRSSIGGQAYAVFVRLADSRGLDRFARSAAFCGGQLLVGSGRHFVRYRDAQAPYGYDAQAIHAGSDGEYVFYTPLATQLYRRVAELVLSRLICQQRLLPAIGGLKAALHSHDVREPLWLLVPSPLLPRLLRYLWLRQIEVGVALPDPTQSADARYTLLQVPGSLARAAGALLGLPGLHFLLPQSERSAVELGHSHPLNLQSLSPLFSDGQRHLFLAEPLGLLSLPASPFVASRFIVQPSEALGEPTGEPFRNMEPTAPGKNEPRPLSHHVAPDRHAPAASSLPKDLSQLARVELGLVRQRTFDCSPAAALVPWSQLAQLSRLAYRLPPSALASLRAVALDGGLLILGDVSHLPLGELFYAAARKILVPLGHSVVPRLPPSALRRALSSSEDSWLLLQPGAPAASDHAAGLPSLDARRAIARIELPADALVELSSLIVARLHALPLAELQALSVAEPAPPQAIYPSLGWLWPLVGGPLLSLREPVALPAATSPTAPATSGREPGRGSSSRSPLPDDDASL